MLEARDITRTYVSGTLKVDVLKGISMRVKKGEVVAVMGPSGSGKSTLLYQLGLLDTPTTGEVLLEGKSVSGLAEDEKAGIRARKIGYIFQDYALLPELTAIENVILPGGSNAPALDEYAARLLHIVGLGGREKFLPSQLSGGEQQRVSVARSMINRPVLLLADEPCANLDSGNSRRVLELFCTLNRTHSMTIVMVTHEQWHSRYAHRVVMLKDGKVSEDGMHATADSLLAQALIHTDNLDFSAAEKILPLIDTEETADSGDMRKLKARLALHRAVRDILTNIRHTDKGSGINAISSLAAGAGLRENTKLKKFVEYYLDYIEKH